MQLAPLDWAIVIAAFIGYLAIGWWTAATQRDDYEHYFLGGRSQPWWLLGISMVATTFAADTPNLVTGIVREQGVFGNWAWWAFLLTGTVTTFFFSALWRRSGVLTDIEFYEFRYSGAPSAFLRGLRAVTLGVLFNVLVMANVTLAAIKIGGVMLGLGPLESVVVAAGITLAYSAAGGLTGVLLTDLVQFVIAVVGAAAAAVWLVNLPEVGGLARLVARPEVAARMAIVPELATAAHDVVLAAVVLPLLLLWWSTYYPGAEPGGGGWVVQRILAAKDERHAAAATLLFNVMHYAVRPWPWIIVALASLVVFPDVASLRAAFPAIDSRHVHDDLAYPAMLTRLPAGLLGLVVTSLIAAYMSTMSTAVNWGSSVVVNDVYRRFFDPAASQHRLVWVGRLATAGLMVASCALALVLRDALQMFQLLLQFGAGTGLVMMLRWYWWRINAAAEIAAVIVAAAVAVTFFVWAETAPDSVPAAWAQLLVGVIATTAASLVVAVVTPPTDAAVLEQFYARVRPTGPGWRTVAAAVRAAGDSAKDLAPTRATAAGRVPLLATIASTAGIWAALFAIGALLYGQPLTAAALAAAAIAGAAVVGACWPRLEFR
ncbi:MAG: sodium:solute symporter family protein [Planctomycetia bacterium]